LTISLPYYYHTNSHYLIHACERVAVASMSRTLILSEKATPGTPEKFDRVPGTWVAGPFPQVISPHQNVWLLLTVNMAPHPIIEYTSEASWAMVYII
jgi:hypothetical protein